MKKKLRTVWMILTAGLILCPAGGILLAEKLPAENQQEKTSSEKRHFPKPRRGNPHKRMQPWEGMLANLPAAEQQRLKKLANENPAAFRKEIFKRFEQERKKQMEELLALRKAYLAAPAGAEKEKAKAALRKRIEDNMKKQSARAERRIRMMEKQLEHFQKRVQKAREQHEKMKNKRDAIVEKILNDFTNPEKEPSFRPPKKEKK